MHAYAAIFAEVGVDARLGLVRVRRMLGFFDAGRIVNPKLADSQALGGMIGGIGQALLEHTVTDHRDGRPVNANLTDYLVPVNADIADLRAVYVDSVDDEAAPLGVEGLGEIVIVVWHPPSPTRSSTRPDGGSANCLSLRRPCSGRELSRWRCGQATR